MAEVFLCGWHPKRTAVRALPLAELSKAERKTVKNFQEYLAGVGHRCPICLHKAKKHEIFCNARGCDCHLSGAQVLELRQQNRVKGWEND